MILLMREQCSHQAVGVDDPVESLPHACEHIEKHLPVTDVSNNVLPSVTARSDVIECTGKLKSQGSGHDSKDSSGKA